MVYPSEPFYVISGFFPRTDIATSAFNFAIGLKSDFAWRMYHKEMTDSAYERLNKTRNEILKSIDLDFSSPTAYPYKFLDNEKGNPTCLLRWCQVYGDACDLGIEGTELNLITDRRLSKNEMVVYNPHNVDSMKQAYGLLSLWLNWADFAYATIN